MKTTVFLMLLNLILTGYPSDQQRLEAFIDKVEKFYRQRALSNRPWEMPNLYPKSMGDNMPMYDVYSLDHETGLLYFPPKGKIWHPELTIELNVNTGIVYDFKTGKKYFFKDLQAKRNKRLLN